jgi:hypothetical protein
LKGPAARSGPLDFNGTSLIVSTAMSTKRNYLVKVLDAKIVDVKRALEAKGIQIESIYEMYKEGKEPEKVGTAAGAQAPAKPPAPSPASTGSGGTAAKESPANNPAESSKPANPAPSGSGAGSPLPSPPSSNNTQ